MNRVLPLISGLLLVALLAAFVAATSQPSQLPVPCRTDAELANLPKDVMAQQRCPTSYPFGG